MFETHELWCSQPQPKARAFAVNGIQVACNHVRKYPRLLLTFLGEPGNKARLLYIQSCTVVDFSSVQFGDTALHLAAQEGKADIVRLLTEAGAQLDIQRTVC